MRPGRLDRRIEFSLPDNEGRAHILRIHARSMSVERDIRFDLIARLCPNTTGAELRSVATEVCRRTSLEPCIVSQSTCRLACLPYVHGARLLLNGTSLTPLRRSSGRAPNFPARTCIVISSKSLGANIKYCTDHFTKCIIRFSASYTVVSF
jgi:hypothetical protein